MMYEDRPLVQALENFQKQWPTSFHVPGHKHGALSGLPEVLQDALSYDVTELTGLDDLHEPTEAILKAEEKLSKLYGSIRSFFLVNGSTVGNLAMLYATADKDDIVLVQRNAHKSVFHAIELIGAQAVFLTPEWDEQTQTAGGVSVETVKAAFREYKDIKAAIFTSPTYYGMVNMELKEIVNICHAYDVPVLVDEAHGAHFVVNKSFPYHALDLGADIVVQSAHKTLPAMTMASFLHIRSKLVQPEQVAHFLHMLQSSSPSYLLMASLDDARHYADTYKEADYAYFQIYRLQLLRGLRSIPTIEVMEVDDALKLLVRVEGYSGFELQEALEQQGIYPELADLYQVLLVLPLVKVGHAGLPVDLESKFKCAVDMLRISKASAPQQILHLPAMPVSAVAYNTAQLREMKSEWVAIVDAKERVAAESIVPYPPGIPLLCAGERALEEHVRQLQNLLDAGSRFQGALDHQTKQIKVVIE